jgi:hypothetical protein
VNHGKKTASLMGSEPRLAIAPNIMSEPNSGTVPLKQSEPTSERVPFKLSEPFVGESTSVE